MSCLYLELSCHHYDLEAVVNLQPQKVALEMHLAPLELCLIVGKAIELRDEVLGLVFAELQQKHNILNNNLSTHKSKLNSYPNTAKKLIRNCPFLQQSKKRSREHFHIILI